MLKLSSRGDREYGGKANVCWEVKEVAKSAVMKLVLLLAQFSNPHKDIVAATLGWMCQAKDVEFEVYYASQRGGGLFSAHGSTIIGGGHYAEFARLLSSFDVSIVCLGDVSLFSSLTGNGQVKEVFSGFRYGKGDSEFLRRMLDGFGLPTPKEAVAIQTTNLPKGLRHGIAQYVFPEVAKRRALGVPVEISREQIDELRRMGIEMVWLIATEDADWSAWKDAGINAQFARKIRQDADYASFTFSLAEHWLDVATGVDYCEPIFASYWLPFCVRNNRLQVCAEEMLKVMKRLQVFAKKLGQNVVYGRWVGGEIGGARNDEDLFPLFREGIAYEVVEPGQPVFTVFERLKAKLPQPCTSPFDLEPSDGQLQKWLSEGKILATFVFHSGELSHNDAMANIMDICATTGIKVGIGVHVQRYAIGGFAVEPMHIPVDEGGVLGLCEPVLHSSGFGIIAESLAQPEKVAEMMAKAREEISQITGERFALRGVYCYLDAIPGKWHEPQVDLWRAIQRTGFEYVISSVSPGENRLLYRDGDFVVINQCGHITYPASPFVRVDMIEELEDMERKMASEGRPVG